MPKAKLKKNKTKANVSKSVDKDVAYIDSLDLNSMWEDFANSFNENGTPSYKTVWSYISKFTKVAKHRDILYWLLGPKVEIKEGYKPKFKFDQYDWEQKRKNGFWYSSQNIESLKNDIHHKASAYESVRQAGKVNVDTIARLNNLLTQLEDEFGGRLFLPKLSQKENGFRAQLYMQLLDKITDLSHKAQLMYAKTQGLDLERLDEFFQLFGNQMGKTAASLMGTQLTAVEDGVNHGQKRMFDQVVNMVMTKATEFDMPLPSDLASAIKDSVEPKKKAKVN